MQNKSISLNQNLKILANQLQGLPQKDKNTLLKELSVCRTYSHYAPTEWNDPKKDNFFKFSRNAAIFFIASTCIGDILTEPGSVIIPITDKATLKKDPKAKKQLQIIEGIDAFVAASQEEVEEFYSTVSKPLIHKTPTRGHDPR